MIDEDHGIGDEMSIGELVDSPASDAVVAFAHPSPADGGPCATCAFRPGTEANQTFHTVTLARLCVEGITPFLCHEKPGLCRGWTAAVNLRGVPETKDESRKMLIARAAADRAGELIADEAARDELRKSSTGRICFDCGECILDHRHWPLRACHERNECDRRTHHAFNPKPADRTPSRHAD